MNKAGFQFTESRERKYTDNSLSVCAHELLTILITG